MFRFRFLVLLQLLSAAVAASDDDFTRADFPPGFIFGSGTSAYQYEGAAFDYGRTPSIWDTYLHSGSDQKDTGDVTCDGYHKFKDDIKLMSEMGLEAFRFSISWSRLIPNGRGMVNPIGLQHYNDFINELLSHGIEPHVSLCHYDVPQALEDEYGGWLGRRIVNDFTAYAEVCFKEFGDRIKFWTTINEGNVFCIGGYANGFTPPGRCSPSFKPGCVGNASTEPYIAAHNMLLSHSATWRLYQEKFKEKQKGVVGFNVFGYGMRPWSDSEEDINASQRALDFFLGWFLSPLVFGRYPESVSNRAHGRIPIISESQSEQLKGSFDFIGLNHYSTLFVMNDPNIHDIEALGFNADLAVNFAFVGSDKPKIASNMFPMVPSVAGLKHPLFPPDGFPIAPSGFISLLEYIKDTYGNPPIYIHENGQALPRDGNLNDTLRIEYLDAYIGAMLDTIRNGSNIKGYMTWTFLDCYELLNGYESGLGFYFVDVNDEELKRYKKFSAGWYSSFLKGKSKMNITPTRLGKDLGTSTF